jgi:hypothetical protein
MHNVSSGEEEPHNAFGIQGDISYFLWHLKPLRFKAEIQTVYWHIKCLFRREAH